MRLDETTPVRIALEEAIKPTVNKRGRPKVTWLKTIYEDLRLGGVELKLNSTESTIEVLKDITKDRKLWKHFIKGLMQ